MSLEERIHTGMLLLLISLLITLIITIVISYMLHGDFGSEEL